MTCLLALDLGTTMGWARFSEGLVTSGSQSFKPSRFEGGGMRFVRFQDWLRQMHHLGVKIDRIAFEEVRRHMGVDAAHVYGGFLSHLQSWCEVNKVPFEGVPVGTIKKHATGTGNASKEAMIKWAKSKGHNPADDNEADALAILYWMQRNEDASNSHGRPTSNSQTRRPLSLERVSVARRPFKR